MTDNKLVKNEETAAVADSDGKPKLRSKVKPTPENTKAELDTAPTSDSVDDNSTDDSDKHHRKINKKDYFFIFLCSALLWGK